MLHFVEEPQYICVAYCLDENEEIVGRLTLSAPAGDNNRCTVTFSLPPTSNIPNEAKPIIAQDIIDFITYVQNGN